MYEDNLVQFLLVSIVPSSNYYSLNMGSFI